MSGALFFLLRLLMAISLYFKQKPSSDNAIYLIFLFMLSSRTHSLLLYPCCAVVLYTPDISLKYLISRMPILYIIIDSF